VRCWPTCGMMTGYRRNSPSRIPEHYMRYLLHVDSRQRFSVVSFVWGPGQRTPIHHHRVWWLMGMLRGAEGSQGFAFGADGSVVLEGRGVQLQPGQVEAVSPRIGDIQQVSNLQAHLPCSSIYPAWKDMNWLLE